MKRTLFVLLIFLNASLSIAQVPYFSSTVGSNKLYGYTSLKVRPGLNAQETYTTFQYGLGNYSAVGLDLYTSNGCSYTGYLFRAGKKLSQWLGIGGQITSSFDLNDSFKFSYLTAAIYMNGAISKDGNFFWCSNTWWGVNNGADNTLTNWEYLGYCIPIKNNQSITPMIGAIHSWEFDQNVDIAAGIYYSIKTWNIYLWGNDILKSNPRIVVGVDFAM